MRPGLGLALRETVKRTRTTAQLVGHQAKETPFQQKRLMSFNLKLASYMRLFLEAKHPLQNCNFAVDYVAVPKKLYCLFVFAPVCFTSAAGAEVLIGVPMDDGRCRSGGGH